MEKYKKREEFILAEQYKRDKNIEGVIYQPFVPTGSYQDRFNDHPDIYIVVDGEKVGVPENWWVIARSSGEKIGVMSDENFNRVYEQVEESSNDKWLIGMGYKI